MHHLFSGADLHGEAGVNSLVSTIRVKSVAVENERACESMFEARIHQGDAV